MKARTAFALLFAGLVCSLAGCTKPIVVGERYVLSATTLATTDEENAMVLIDNGPAQNLQNKLRPLYDASHCDALALLYPGTVIRVLRLHDGKVGRLVFVEVTDDPISCGDYTRDLGLKGHRYWLKAPPGLLQDIDEWNHHNSTR